MDRPDRLCPRGPVGWIAGAAIGAGAGAVTAKVVDLGISDEWVAWFRDVVQPDTATIVLLVIKLDRDTLVTEAERFSGAELVYANLDESTIERLKEALGDTHVDATRRRDPAPRTSAEDGDAEPTPSTGSASGLRGTTSPPVAGGKLRCGECGARSSRRC